MRQILLLPGDGIGPEIITEAERLLQYLNARYDLKLSIIQGLIGGAAIDAVGDPLPEETLRQARSSVAVLLGAVGGPAWDSLPVAERPERGLLRLRSELGLYANLRPAVLYPELIGASALRPEIVSKLDLLIVRELTGGLYFGEPRGRHQLPDGDAEAFNTLRYSEKEIKRVAHVAFTAAAQRRGRLCSVDKANALESMALWREVVQSVAAEYPNVTLQHMYVDNAAMQLVRDPGQFDVILTENLFGDILSDLAAMLTGSIGLLASASLDESDFGLYEPIHGSAPDIAGKGTANPLACLLSVALLFRHSLKQEAIADEINAAVRRTLQAGMRTPDMAGPEESSVNTRFITDFFLDCLKKL